MTRQHLLELLIIGSHRQVRHRRDHFARRALHLKTPHDQLLAIGDRPLQRLVADREKHVGEHQQEGNETDKV